MEAQLELDSNIQSVEVNADSLDEALADAAVQLDSRIAHLEYEVIERGSDGFLGIGKKPWKLKIYQDPETIVKRQKDRLELPPLLKVELKKKRLRKRTDFSISVILVLLSNSKLFLQLETAGQSMKKKSLI